ncbi:tetratricopeptide repeat protein [Oscillatoria sp. CS-180]|uniref:tetratricopeptide repeat protein n=1 Tax=Oscillatoria sp. CS-180 TaxID=3021720 RepID=UPI00232E5ED0|nr:tetratricopeptide repeat protein [Oscillatoria sp. CS-180]MDB9529479.1 tetratricopeptide repeat protein [Oscillatoria sp. CS-180]
MTVLSSPLRKIGDRLLACISICLLVFLLVLEQPALADSAAVETESTPALTIQERKELEELRTEKRLKQLIDARIGNSPRIQDRIEFEVDRAFERTTTLLNIVLAILTIIPLLAALGVWLLRRSVVSELVGEVRTQLEREIFAQLKQQKLDAIAEIEALKQDSLKQGAELVAQAQAVLDELKQQTAIAHQEIELLKSQTASQLESIVTDAQQMKDQAMQELTNLLPLSVTEQLPPEARPRLGNLTSLLEGLKKAMPQISFSATDYLKEGNAFFFESRYDDALAAYDRAIQLNPELYEAWFTKASTLMLLQRYEEATNTYQFATQLKPESYDAWVGQGTALTKAHNYEGAIAAFNEAIALKATDHLALFNRGDAYAGLERFDAALADYDAALALKPDFAKGHWRKGQLLQERGNWESAIAAYDAVLNLNIKDESDIWYNKAICHAAKGDRDAALTALEKAVSASPALKQQAQEHPRFESLQETLRFQALVNSDDDESP